MVRDEDEFVAGSAAVQAFEESITMVDCIQLSNHRESVHLLAFCLRHRSSESIFAFQKSRIATMSCWRTDEVPYMIPGDEKSDEHLKRA